MGKHIIEEKTGDFHYARHIYRILKNNARSLGDNEDISWAYLKEKQSERRTYFHWLRCYHPTLREQAGWQKWIKVVGLGTKYAVKYVSSAIFNLLYGYGDYTKPGWERLIAGLESSIGILCVAFFSIAMAKRTSDR